MIVIDWNEIKNYKDYFATGTGISVGSFDGLHKGHRVLLKKLTDGCCKNKLLPGVVTFTKPLPAFKKAGEYKGDICSLTQKLKLLQKLGMEFVILAEFTPEFAKATGCEFFDYLKDNCNLKYIVEGVDFRCGYKGSTDIIQIAEYGKQNNIETSFVEHVFYKYQNNNVRISSSIIREEVLKGNIDLVKELLDRNYELKIVKAKELVLEKEKVEFEKSDFYQALPETGKFIVKDNNKNEYLMEMFDNKFTLQNKSNCEIASSNFKGIESLEFICQVD